MDEMSNCRPLVRVYMFAMWVLVLALIAPTAAFSKSEFNDPWERLASGVSTDTKKACPIAPKISPNLSVKAYYKDKKGSIIDEQKYKKTQAGTSALRQAARKIVEFADQYQLQNDSASARCAGDWLFSLAKNNALAGKMTGNQAYFMQTWLLNSYATAWLKVRSGYSFDQKQVETIENWLRRMAKSVMQFHNGRESMANLRYWGGLANVTVGIAVEDEELFDWGVQTYRLGLKQIASDGTLPREMERGSKALSYHMFALTPLVMIAELASFNDLDLYGENNNALGKLVAKTVSGIRDSSDFSRAAGVKQKKLSNKGTQLIWLRLYSKHFNTSEYDDLLKKYPNKNSLYLGGQCCSY